MVETARPDTVICRPEESRKTALGRKTQSFWDKRFKFCIKACRFFGTFLLILNNGDFFKGT